MKRNTKIKRLKRFVSLVSFSFILCVFWVNNLIAQTPEQIKFYSERIEFGTDEVKRNALFDLRNFKTESASRIALPALRDSSEIVRATATHSVIYLPKDESARVLRPLLNEKAEFIRRETAFALGKTQNPNVAEDLLNLLSKDKKQSVRDAAAVSLGLIGNQVAIEPLLKILNKKPKKKQKFFRRSVARSIGNIAESIQRKSLSFETPESFLPTQYKFTEKVIYKDLTEDNNIFLNASNTLIKVLGNEKEFPNAKREIAFALGAIGSKKAVPILTKNLANEDYYLAEICKEALLKINS